MNITSATYAGPTRPFAPAVNAGTGGAGGFDQILSAAKGAAGGVVETQADAARAIEQFALGETDDVAGVLSRVEKGELAFKTLLAVRTKLVSALDEIRNMPV